MPNDDDPAAGLGPNADSTHAPVGEGDFGSPPDLSVHQSGGETSRAGLFVGVAAVVVVALLAAAAVAFVVHLRSPDDPVDVVRSFLNAQADQDCETIADLTVGDLAAEQCEQATEEIASESIELDIVDISEIDEATSTVATEYRVTIGEGHSAYCVRYETTFGLQQDDDRWLISHAENDEYESLPSDEC